MKHFVIALILLGLVLASVLVNGYFVRKYVKETLEMTRSLPEAKEEFLSYQGNIGDFVAKWYDRHPFLSLSIHMCELERVCEGVAEIRACVEAKSYENYMQAKRRLEAVLTELADGEKPTFINIF